MMEKCLLMSTIISSLTIINAGLDYNNQQLRKIPNTTLYLKNMNI